MPEFGLGNTKIEKGVLPLFRAHEIMHEERPAPALRARNARALVAL